MDNMKDTITRDLEPVVDAVLAESDTVPGDLELRDPGVAADAQGVEAVGHLKADAIVEPPAVSEAPPNGGANSGQQALIPDDKTQDRLHDSKNYRFLFFCWVDWFSGAGGGEF